MAAKPATTDISPPVATDYNYDQTSDPIYYCDSFNCSDGYTLIDNAADEECVGGKCQASQCCDMVCISFDCPKKYSLVEDADTIVCEGSGCTQDLCCEKRKNSSNNNTIFLCSRVWGMSPPFPWNHKLAMFVVP